MVDGWVDRCLGVFAWGRAPHVCRVACTVYDLFSSETIATLTIPSICCYMHVHR